MLVVLPSFPAFQSGACKGCQRLLSGGIPGGLLFMYQVHLEVVEVGALEFLLELVERVLNLVLMTLAILAGMGHDGGRAGWGSCWPGRCRSGEREGVVVGGRGGTVFVYRARSTGNRA